MTEIQNWIVKPMVKWGARLVGICYRNLDRVLFLHSPMKRALNLYYNDFPDLFFLHIHKCGGTSIDDAIKRWFPFSNYTIASAPSFRAAKSFYQELDNFADEAETYYVPKYRELLLLYLMGKKIKFISGHIPFSKVAYSEFGSKYKFITCLRDPVERWFSTYLYIRFVHRDYGRTDEDIMTFLQSERAKHLGHQYVAYLGGVRKGEDYASQPAIYRAKANLHKFEIIGFTEHLEDFQRKFEDRFGFKLKVPHKKKNPISDSYRRSVTPEVGERVRAICKPDLEIYQYAIDNFGPFSEEES